MTAGRPIPTLPYWTCQPCDKRAFPTRRHAKTAARTQHTTTGRLHPYPCPTGDGWHVGHMPAPIRDGHLDRRTYAATVTPKPKEHR